MSAARTVSLVAVILTIMFVILAALLVVAAVIVFGGLLLMLMGLIALAAQFADPQALTEAMRQLEPAAQVQVIRDLGDLGPDAEPYLGMLKERFEVGEPDVQAAALEALKKIDPEQWEHFP